ncbi:hypothetical protein PVNG_05910 [Plasmodium vivax North Korean]|uniref:Variable surface protein Vir35 n=1 Tax=Plasmodium vivax North Korean TaxID=1035514 RepID=A0A0J9U2A4_PLAVI|nr:hypothetical protein PVNG_05910 [Plasmodium vivax North Korean]
MKNYVNSELSISEKLIYVNTTTQYFENENGNKVNISLDVRTHRLLAKHEYQNEMPTRGLQNKVSYSRDDYKLEKGKRNNNTFQQLKQSGTNYVDDYFKSYKKRYSKKRGLKKLDCYCEKKVLDKIHGLYAVGRKLKNEKKSFKKFFFKKYGIGLILFALTPALGFIYNILFGVNDWGRGIFKLCDKNNEHNSDDNSKECPDLHKYKWEKTLNHIGYFNYVFTFIMLFVVLVVVIYILMKVIKYEKLKAGKSKMNIKEYCTLCKDVF